MKTTSCNFLFIFNLSLLLFASCQHHDKDQLVGTWQMTSVKLASSEKQQQMWQSQINMLQDSISKNTDTAKLNKFQRQLDMVKKRTEDLKSKQDSAVKKTQWEFKSNGDFIATQAGHKNAGLWSLDEDKMILFTIIEKQTYSQHVNFASDTLILHLDSLSYLKFARAKS